MLYRKHSPVILSLKWKSVKIWRVVSVFYIGVKVAYEGDTTSSKKEAMSSVGQLNAGTIIGLSGLFDLWILGSR